MKFKKIIYDFFLALIMVYLALSAFIYFNQKNFLYFPDEQGFQDCNGFGRFEKQAVNTTRFFYKLNPGRDLLVFYHGNAGSVCDTSNLVSKFNRNISYIFVEYAGYSNDDRTPSKNLIMSDVHNVNSFIKQLNYSGLILFGESIGTGPASFHAAISNADKLILISPYSSISDISKDIYWFLPINLLLTENFDNQAYLQGYKGRVIILHGNRDDTIKPHFSKKLYDSLTTPTKEYILINNARHNDMYSYEKTWDTIDSFIDGK